MRKSVKVFAPATVANVVCGYDVLGFAVNEPGDEVIMRLTDKPGVTLLKITGDEGRLPLDPDKNTVSAIAKQYLEHIGRPEVGIKIELYKKCPSEVDWVQALRAPLPVYLQSIPYLIIN